MPVRSKRVAGPTALTAAGVDIYTVPAGETFRGEFMIVNLDVAVTRVATVRINGATFYRTSVLADNVAAKANVVGNPGDVFNIGIAGGAGTATMYGSELDGVAS